jgi:hypothetical protein
LFCRNIRLESSRAARCYNIGHRGDDIVY